MDNIVITARSFNGYFDFVATSFQALKDGLRHNKWPYKPVIYRIDAFGKPKFVKLKSVQLKNIFEELKMK
jgi:hypothetical protein